MSSKRVNIRSLILRSFFLSIILIFGSLVFHKTDYFHSDRKDNSTPIETYIIQSNATVCSGIDVQAYQQIWICNKDNFKLLTFDKTKFTYSKKADQRIILLQNIHKNILKPLISLLLYNQLPLEKEELPVLS